MADESATDVLAQLKGGEASLKIEGFLPVPESLKSLEDAIFRQNAIDAWTNATKLQRLLHLWAIFLSLVELGSTVNEETQQKVEVLFPEFQAFKKVLDQLAARPNSNWIQELNTLHTTFVGLVTTNVNALSALKVQCEPFCFSEQERMEAMGKITEWKFRLNATPPAFSYPQNSKNKASKLATKLESFLKLLESAPATAFNLPRHSALPETPEVFAAQERERASPVASSTQEESGAMRFRKVGTIWNINFREEQGQFPELDGFKYLAEILRARYKSINALDLRGAPVELKAAKHSEQYAADREALRTLHQKLRDLNEEIDEAKENNDAVSHEKLAEQKEQLLIHVKGLTSKNGKQKKVGPPSAGEKAAESVRKSLGRAYQQLTSSMPELVKHLRALVRQEGAFFTYYPPSDFPPWEL